MFVQFKPNQTNLKSLNTSVFIDSSGSTGGAIMIKQLKLYSDLKSRLNITKLIGWSDSAKNYDVATRVLRSEGGTDPSCFLKFWNNEKSVVVFTDGEIDMSSMAKFKKELASKPGIDSIPIIIVLTIGTIGSLTIEKLEKSINMSIPESFLSLSNNVVVLISDGLLIRTLMSKGCFSQTFPAPNLTPELKIALEKPTDLDKLNECIVDQGVPSNLIKLPGKSDYFDLESLKLINGLEQIDLIEQLCSRSLLPRLDLGIIHTVLDTLAKKTNANPALDFVRDKLYQAATNPQIAGTEAHIKLIELYNQTKASTKSDTNRQLLARINILKQIINEYQKNSTSFTYGSNRAAKASEVSDSVLDQIGTCVQVECPIYITEGPGCIVFKEPNDVPNYVSAYTSDYWLESPFELGLELAKWISPGIYCREMVERMDKNPYSMEPVIGWIPLTSDPMVAMAHMSKVFGGKKQLWHFTRAYCGLLAELANKFWAQDHKDKILKILTTLTKSYSVSEDLKASVKKIPLYDALKYVVTNFSTCLRDRFYPDVMVLLKIIDGIRSELVYPKDKIEAMCKIVSVFDRLLRAHKKGDGMLSHVMELDDWGHYKKFIPGVEGLVAQILWYDREGKYKQYKLQMAIDKACVDKKFGKAFRAAFNGESWDQSVLECALPELKGLDLVVDVWDSDGLSKLTCGYDGKVFESSKEKLAHISKLLGPYFFNGHAAVKSAIWELGKWSSHKLIFANAKARLYRAYGEQYPALHTTRAKERLQLFISKLT